jgi:hypothetical protein
VPHKRAKDLKAYIYAYGRLFSGADKAQVEQAVKQFEEDHEKLSSIG